MNTRETRRNFRRATAAAVVLAAALLAANAVTAQLETEQLSEPDWLGLAAVTDTGGSLILKDQLFTPDPASSSEELPGLGHKFELFGVMMRDTDPENPVGESGGSGGGGGGNETISATMIPGAVALAFRNLPPGIKITALTNQIGLKYFFVSPRTCGGGSPRISLLIDADSDGDTDFAAHGHVNAPAYSACVMDKWWYEDLADDLPRWEVTPGGAVPGVPVFPFTPWKAFATAVTTAFPNHRVTAGFLVDDSCSFDPTTCGKAYYDLVTVENRTLEIWHDTVRK